MTLPARCRVGSDEWKLKNKERVRAWVARNRERHRETKRKWKREHPELVAASNKRYALAHPEKMREKWQRHQARFPEKCCARTKRYADKNRAAVNAKLREYFKTPQGRAAAVNGEAKRRARLKACETSATTQEIAALLASATHCHYCATAFGVQVKPTIDHVVALSRGGAHALSNFVVACRSCNSAKHTTDYGAFIATRRRAA